MNTSSAVETKTPFSFKDTLFKAVPESIVGRTLFWGALPALLFLYTVGVSFLCVSPFSPYFPFLALLGSVLCLRWRTLGLCTSYVALTLLVLGFLHDIPFEDRLWQMGIVFALAVDFFILLLAIEEVEAIIGQIAEVGRVKVKELNQSQLQLQQLNQEKEELQQSLDEEIEQLKAEAEQRRIEKHQESKRVELIHSEIELLTSQKESFVAEAKKAREILEQVGESQQILDEAEEKIALMEGQLIELTEELNQTRASKDELTEKLSDSEELKTQVATLTASQHQTEAVKNENAALQTKITALTEHLNLAEIVKNENEALQTQIAALTESQSQAEIIKSENEVLQGQTEVIKGENEALQTKVTALTESLNRSEAKTKEALVATQEKILTLQQCAHSTTTDNSAKINTAEFNKLEGLYKQLRIQFEEKSRVLTQTRKELFQTHGKFLALQHEQQLTALSPDQKEALFYEKELKLLFEEVSRLEEEVLILEELVSHNHSQ